MRCSYAPHWIFNRNFIMKNLNARVVGSFLLGAVVVKVYAKIESGACCPPLQRGCEKIRFLRPQVFGVRRFFAALDFAHTLIARSLKAYKAPLPIDVDVFCKP